MELNTRETEFVALGAALGSNCIPCVEIHVRKSREAGLSDAQIRAAVELADKVRKVPAGKALEAAHRLLGTGAGSGEAATTAASLCGDAKPAAAGTLCC